MPTPGNNALAKVVLPVAGAAVVAGLLASYVLLIKPKIELVMPGGALDVEVVRARMQSREERAAQFVALKDALQKMNGERRTRLALAMPASPDVPGLFVTLDALAKKHGFVVTSVDVVADDRIVLPSGAGVLSVSLNITGGTYAELKALLGSFTSSLRIMDVQSVVFTPDSGNYSMVIRTYYVPPSDDGAGG